MPRITMQPPFNSLLVDFPSLAVIARMLDWCVETDDGHDTACWLWQGYTDKDGYAEMKFRGRKFRVNRVSFRTFKGPIPQGLDVDHMCRNRACMNPEHLECVDPHTNRVVRRAARIEMDKRAKAEVPF